MLQKLANKIQHRKSPNDNIYTPLSVALKMIEMCDIKEGEKVLDPCFGGGIFYNNFPEGCEKFYCEIEQGKDFFDFDTRVDWVIGNPPFSIWNEWIAHTIKITDKFCYIFGSLNFSDVRIRTIIENGFGVTKIHCVRIKWWFSHQYMVVFEKNKQSIITVSESVIRCDVCNDKPKCCKRGLQGNSYNICTNQK